MIATFDVSARCETGACPACDKWRRLMAAEALIAARKESRGELRGRLANFQGGVAYAGWVWDRWPWYGALLFWVVLSVASFGVLFALDWIMARFDRWRALGGR